MEGLSYRCRVLLILLTACYIDRNLTVIIDGMGVEDLIDSVAANLGNIQIVDWLSGIGILKVKDLFIYWKGNTFFLKKNLSKQ